MSIPDFGNSDNSTEYELAIIRRSRELAFGIIMRQNFLFKAVRRFRLKNMMVQIDLLGAEKKETVKKEYFLLGIWYDEFNKGMLFDFLEHDHQKWKVIDFSGSPFNKALRSNQRDRIRIYTTDINLRIDFLMTPGGGKIFIRTPKSKKIIDLHSEYNKVVSIYPNKGSIELIENDLLINQDKIKPIASKPINISNRFHFFSSQDIEWIEQQRKISKPISINHPHWRGILASAKELFGNVYLIPDDLDPNTAQYFAQLFVEAGVPSVTIQGFPKSYFHLVKALRSISPKLPIFTIYHGNFLHMREDYDWHIFKIIKSLYEQGDIKKVGFVKFGMAEIMSASGINSQFIMNLVRRVPTSTSTPSEPGIQIGIWSNPDWNWKKSPYAMLAGMKIIDNPTAHLYNVSPRAADLARLLKIKCKVYSDPIPQDEVVKETAKMHLNLYVTLTECAPMLPLESLSAGSPCLFGPTSHYFLDNEFLLKRLVVPYPDNSLMIGQYAERAIEDREEIIEVYRDYAPTYNMQALNCLSEFLEFPIT